MSLKPMLIDTLNTLSPLISETPMAGIITGTGLSDTPDGMEIHHRIHYKDLPHFPVSTVESHAGELVLGRVQGKTTLVFQGRFHLYEGYTPAQVTYPVRVLAALGVKNLILSNAAGGLDLSFTPGDIMEIRDHINLTGKNPLVGPNEDDLGLRFPDMTRVYSEGLGEWARETAQSQGLDLKSGTYAGLLGPSLETPSETRYLGIIGAQAVGFSTVMEAIAGVHAEMNILGLSMITNVNDPDHPEPATLESVVAVARRAAPKLSALTAGILARL